jgi:hypothetical protein
MRWNTKVNKLKGDIYRPWFAIYPVLVSQGKYKPYIWIWLDTIGRLKYFWMGYTDGGLAYEYCLKEMIEIKNKELEK